MAQSGSQTATDSIGWQELTTDNGQKYRVGASDYNIADKVSGTEDAPAASGPPFNGIKLNWAVGTEGTPSEDIQDKTGITWYKFEKNGTFALTYFKYKLTINTKDTYNYIFYDEEPDYYNLNVWKIAGTHYVEFDSKRPKIVSVSDEELERLWIVALGQSSRNVFRGTPETFYDNAKAWDMATDAIARDLDKGVSVIQATAFYMPLLQRESTISLVAERSLFEGFKQKCETDEEHRWVDLAVTASKRQLEQLRKHGRYPTKNALLGRNNTGADEEFLKQHVAAL